MLSFPVPRTYNCIFISGLMSFQSSFWMTPSAVEMPGSIFKFCSLIK